MSLVGTRPILQDELRQYELHHRARIAIKPGITGMWQVSGRSDITDLATDPDCDRVGIAVKNKAGEYELLTGNQTGMLLLDYICSQRIKHGKMPADPVMIKTIVTMDMGEQIAAHYGLRTVNVLTGFKFIGEQIGKLEQLGKVEDEIAKTAEKWIC